MTAAVDTILGQWRPHTQPDERSFYACSPHRIEMTAHLIRSAGSVLLNDDEDEPVARSDEAPFRR
jgi:hypothetical protein